MRRTVRGFTLIELMIVIAIIAIIAAIAIPNLLAARLTTNEVAAIATLRQILVSQSAFQTGARVDEDNNGTGEYGGLLDMSGAPMPRAGGTTLFPPVLAPGFQALGANFNGGQAATRSGYFFQVFLPANAAGAPGAEPAAGFGLSPDTTTVAARESLWCAYGWPQNYNSTGNRTFFVNQAGDILFNDWDTDPVGAAPTGVAAFPTGQTHMRGTTAVGAVGNQPGTGVWRSVD